MIGPAVGRVYVRNKGQGVAFADPAHPGFLTVLIRGEEHFVARSRVRFVAKKKED